MSNSEDEKDVGWCEECQDWFPEVEDTIVCDCDEDFSLDCDKPLDFND